MLLVSRDFKLSRLFIFFFIVIFAGVLQAEPYLCKTVFQDLPLTEKEYQIFERLSTHKAVEQKVYETAQVNEIARALVFNIRQQELRYEKELSGRKDQKPVDLKKESEIMLFFDVKSAESIAQRGFLNQHLIFRSGGMNNSKVRRWIEDWYSNLRLGESREASLLRPKSAYLNIQTNRFLGQRKMLPHAQFGGVAAVFKDYVKDQSLWTSYNSLEVGKRIGLFGSAKDAVGDVLNKYSQAAFGKKIAKDNVAEKALLPFRGTFQRNMISTAEHVSYHEALIYGEVTLKDVKYFIVMDPFQASKLVKYKKPIYFSKVVEVQQRPYYTKETLLFDGEQAADPSFNTLLGLK